MNWMVKVILILLLTLVAHWAISKLIGKIRLRLKESPGTFDEDFARSTRKPILALLWLLALFWMYDVSAGVLQWATSEMKDRVFFASLAVIIGWFMIRLIANRERFHLNSGQGKYDATAIIAVAKIGRLIVWVLVGITTMQTLGIDASGIIAFGGISGAALAFASRDLLSNFFGGMIVYLDKPFKVGDWVRSPDQEIEGTVEYIGWRVTIIRTFDKRPLYVPNSIFARIAVENPSRMSHRRIYETIGIRYADVSKMTDIVDQVKTMLNEHPEIATDQTMIINFNKFGPSSLDFFIYVFTKTTEWVYYHEVKQDVLLKIANIITDNGAEVAFPTQTLHIDQIENKA